MAPTLISQGAGSLPQILHGPNSDGQSGSPLSLEAESKSWLVPAAGGRAGGHLGLAPSEFDVKAKVKVP